MAQRDEIKIRSVEFKMLDDDIAYIEEKMASMPAVSSLIYASILLLVSIKFLKFNKFLKTSIILFLSDVFSALFALFIPDFIARRFPNAEIENKYELFKLNLSDWSTSELISNNVMNIIFCVVLIISIIFAVVGILKIKRK